MKNIKVISFDVEGTLTTTDFSYAIWFESIQEAYASRYNVSLEDAKSIVMNEFQKVDHQLIESNDINYWFRKFNLHSLGEILEKYKDRVQYYPEVIEVLKLLHGKYRLIIASGTSRNALRFLLKDVSGYFQAVFSSISDYGQLKTPEFYRSICQELKVKPDQVVHIGDNWQYDYLAALEIGIHAFHVDRTGQTCKKESFKDLTSIKNYLMDQ